MKNDVIGKLAISQSSAQDELVIAYINALEGGDIAIAEVLKKQIKYFTEQTDFDFTVPETIAMYAHLTNKQTAYKYILQHDLFPKFHLPEEKVMLLCALKYGYVGMLDILIAKDNNYFEVMERNIHKLYNVASARHIITKYPSPRTTYRALIERAIDDNDKEMFDFLLPLCGPNNAGAYNAINYAGRAGNLEMLKHCLSHVNDIDSWKLWPPIEDFTSNVEILKFILNYDQGRLQQYGAKALLSAVGNAHLESIKYLISIGVQIEDAHQGLLLPSYFYKASSFTIIDVLIFCEQQLKIKFNKFSLLTNAISYKHIELVKHLLSGENPLKLSECKNISTYILHALGKTSLEIVEYLISQGLDLQQEEKEHVATQLWALNNDFECIKRLSSMFDMKNSKMFTSNLFAILLRSDAIEVINYYRSIGCNELCDVNAFSTAINQKRYDIAEHIASIQKDEVAQYISSVLYGSSSNKSYQEYCELKTSLSQNASLLVMTVPFDTSIIPTMKDAPKIQRGMFAVYEMMYCAIECPTEVLYLIAKQILGFELNAQTLSQYHFLTQLNIPREIEVQNCDRHSQYKSGIILKLLYLEHNKIEAAI